MSPFEHLRKSRNRQPSPLTRSTGSEIVTPIPTMQTIQRARSLPNSLQPTDVLMLQRSVGNTAVGNLLGRNQAPAPQPSLAQPSTVQHMPLSNTVQPNIIQRQTDDELSEDDTDSDSDIDGDLEEVEDETEESEDFHTRMGIPASVPAYHASHGAILKKMGRRRRLMNKLLYHGALTLDRAKNKVTGGSNFSLAERASQRNRRQYIEAKNKLWWGYYENQLSSPQARRQFRKKKRAFKKDLAQTEQEKMQQKEELARNRKEKGEYVAWKKSRGLDSMISF